MKGCIVGNKGHGKNQFYQIALDPESRRLAYLGLFSRRIHGRILKYVTMDATQKTDPETSKVVGFIFSGTLKHQTRIS